MVHGAEAKRSARARGAAALGSLHGGSTSICIILRVWIGSHQLVKVMEVQTEDMQQLRQADMVESRRRDSQTIEIQVDQLSEDLDLHLHLRGRGSREHQHEERDVQRSGRQSIPENQTSRAAQEPWKLEWFSMRPQSKSDRWDDALWSQHGWMVRSHRKERKQPFHPIHRSTPMSVESLHPERVPVVFNEQGKDVYLDHWKQATTFPV